MSSSEIKYARIHSLSVLYLLTSCYEGIVSICIDSSSVFHPKATHLSVVYSTIIKTDIYTI